MPVNAHEAQVPRFTIVTPSYNQAPFIAETIRSVLTQAGRLRNRDLVMDGGSTDGSVDIIRATPSRSRRATGTFAVRD